MTSYQQEKHTYKSQLTWEVAGVVSFSLNTQRWVVSAQDTSRGTILRRGRLLSAGDEPQPMAGRSAAPFGPT